MIRATTAQIHHIPQPLFLAFVSTIAIDLSTDQNWCFQKPKRISSLYCGGGETTKRNAINEDFRGMVEGYACVCCSPESFLPLSHHPNECFDF